MLPWEADDILNSCTNNSVFVVDLNDDGADDDIVAVAEIPSNRIKEKEVRGT